MVEAIHASVFPHVSILLDIYENILEKSLSNYRMAKVTELHNYYEILGVNKDASMQDIKKVYRDKALSEHPDKGGDDERMALLNIAYETLSDPIERGKFDQDWKDFNATFDTEVPSVPLDHLPTAGIAFSKTYRQQHAEYVEQFHKEPLNQTRSSFCFNNLHSDLYNCDDNISDDLFSFIKAKKNCETKLDIGSLTPEKAVEYFINFLQGDYSGDTLKVISRAFHQKLKQLEMSREQDGYDFKLYSGIYEILLVAVKEKTPSANILFSLHKITEYAKHNTDQSISFMAPLFQRKHFRTVFAQALHYYWVSEESVLDESYTKAFNGEASAKSFFDSLKSKLCQNRNAKKSNDGIAKLLRYARLLYKLEQDMNKSADMTTTNIAAFYRKKAFHLLDWVPSLLHFAGIAITINTLLQIGTTLLRAAQQEHNPVLSMADEKLATQICLFAVCLSHHENPDVELYACVHSVKCLLSCRYTDSEFEKNLKAFQHRTLWLTDMFPFFELPKSNADFMAQEGKTLELMRQLLHALIDKIEHKKQSVEKDVIDHSYVRVVYQAYEACLKNWYEKEPNLVKENEFRQRLMKELLKCKQWTKEDINYNLRACWPLNDIDEKGWTLPKSSVTEKANIPTYRTVRGVQFNFKTGKIDFILDYCKVEGRDHNCLITLFDLSELFQRCLTSAVFSLDPVNPDMPYHPFNHMFFAPTRMQHSQLLHTMFLADYLLKFLATGQEVQRWDPYKLRSLNQIICKLPGYLKKVIYDLHASSHKESFNRFWIESEEVDTAIDDRRDESGDILFALGNIRMVVKHKKMELDAEGNLVDKEGEDEGWDCYILTLEQKRELYTGKRVIEDSALIIIKESWELLFWENNKATYSLALEENRHDLITLSKRQRDSQEKIKIEDSESLRQIYRIVIKAAEKTRMPHRYSPEFIFAQEFTKYYDEFAIYFSEFARLRELCKVVSLANIMATQRAKNQEETHLIRRRLNYKHFCGLQAKKSYQVKEHDYWQTTSKKLKEFVKENIIKQLKEWRNKLSKEKLEQKRKEVLNDIRQKIGTLHFTRFSPEIQEICDRFYDGIKRDIIADHGYSGWNSVSHKVYREAIEPKIPNFIADLESQKKAACHKQLSELFKDELAEFSKIKVSELINEYLEHNSKPLLEQLVYYDRTQVAKQIKEVFPGHTLDTLDKALNSYSFAIDEIVDKETEKAIKLHEQWLKEDLSGREKLEQTYCDLGFGDDAEEIKQEDSCSWVPASFRHDIEEGHSRTVYGGVLVAGGVRIISNPKQAKALVRGTRETSKQLQKNNVSIRTLCENYGLSVDKLKKDIINPKLLSALEKQTKKDGKNPIKNNIVGKGAEKVFEAILNKLLSSNNRFRVVSSRKETKLSTPYGRRYPDLVIEEKCGDHFKPVMGLEIKTGRSPYVRPQPNGQQKKSPTIQGLKDDWHEQQDDGYPIILVRLE